jgi:hypothetical protein
MTHSEPDRTLLSIKPIPPHERLIVPLDVDSYDEAISSSRG